METNKLGACLKDRGSSQKWLGERSGVSVWDINRHINKGLTLTDAQMKEIAKVLGKKVSDLF